MVFIARSPMVTTRFYTDVGKTAIPEGDANQFYRVLHKVADDRLPAATDAIVQALESGRQSLPMVELRNILETDDTPDRTAHLVMQSMDGVLRHSLEDGLWQVLGEVVQDAATRFARKFYPDHLTYVPPDVMTKATQPTIPMDQLEWEALTTAKQVDDKRLLIASLRRSRDPATKAIAKAIQQAQNKGFSSALVKAPDGRVIGGISWSTVGGELKVSTMAAAKGTGNYVLQRMMQELAGVADGMDKGLLMQPRTATGAAAKYLEQLGWKKTGSGPSTAYALPASKVAQFAAAPFNPSQLQIEMQGSLNLLNPKTVDFLRSYKMNLISGVTNTTRDSIRAIVQEAFAFGGHPYEQASLIKDMVGLTPRQAKALTNYRAMLQSEGMSKIKVKRLVDKYRERQLKWRARNIARTETIRASTQGQNAVWQQLVDEDIVSSEELRRIWIITPDDRLCSTCEAIPGMNPEGVRIDEMFQTPAGPVDGPPAHPQCRCALGSEYVTVTKKEKG